MNTKQKILFLLEITDFTQAKLANELGVTTATVNRWVNQGVVPHASVLQRIDRELTKRAGIVSGEFEKPISYKERFIEEKKKEYKNPLLIITKMPDIQKQFELSLTYNTNRLEGSTLTEEDTAAILFEDAALSNKTLTEQLEAKNHQAAIRFLFDWLLEKKPISEELVLALHRILMNSIRPDAGNYRSHAVRIAGSFVPTANYLKVPERMKELMHSLAKKDISLAVLADSHAIFEQIHPFSDGNGRVGRLFMNALALKGGLAPVVISQKKRKVYLSALKKAQLENQFVEIQEVVASGVIAGYRILERK